MSEFDVEASKIVSKYLLPISILTILLYYVGKYYRKELSDKLFALLFVHVCWRYSKALESTKEELFSDLGNFKSLDWDLRNRGNLRILEIGVGPGSNFKFYPKNCRVIAVDPNPHFKKYMEQSCSQFPHIVLESIIIGHGEDLASIPNDTIDVVITTSVLCSVSDVDQVLREVKRVLAPGGKYLFMEHVLGKEGSWCRTVQNAINPLWNFLCQCHPNREIEKNIQRAGFPKVEFKSFEPKLASILKLVVVPHIFGMAEK